MFDLNKDAEISRNKFLEIMKKNFESKDEKQWENLWSLFARERDSCNVGSIIKVFQKYECK
jgi:Ca2+-binding EF-hand superfamily protein